MRRCAQSALRGAWHATPSPETLAIVVSALADALRVLCPSSRLLLQWRLCAQSRQPLGLGSARPPPDGRAHASREMDRGARHTQASGTGMSRFVECTLSLHRGAPGTCEARLCTPASGDSHGGQCSPPLPPRGGAALAFPFGP